MAICYNALLERLSTEGMLYAVFSSRFQKRLFLPLACILLTACGITSDTKMDAPSTGAH